MLMRVGHFSTYDYWRLNHPVLGILLVIGLDVLCVGLGFLSATLIGKLARWLHHQTKSARGRQPQLLKKRWLSTASSYGLRLTTPSPIKKRYTIMPALGLFVAPSVFRFFLPHLYSYIQQNYSFAGRILTVILDIVWLWVALLGVMLVAGFVRQIRSWR